MWHVATGHVGKIHRMAVYSSHIMGRHLVMLSIVASYCCGRQLYYGQTSALFLTVATIQLGSKINYTRHTHCADSLAQRYDVN